MTDKEYLTYLKTKNFEDLEDIISHFNKSQNPQRYEVIKQVWDKKRKAEPEVFAAFSKELRYKTIPRRIGAALIDAVLIWAGNALGSYLAVRISFETEFILHSFRHFSHLLWALIILVPMVKYGKTPGMHFAGVQLCDRSENDSNLPQRLFREGVFIFPQIILSIFPELLALSWTIVIFWLQLSALIIANPIIIYFDKKHRGINDMMAKTVILRTKLDI